MRLGIFVSLVAFLTSSAFAAEDFPLMAELSGDNCVVTNDSGEFAEVVQVRFNYSCSDGLVRRGQYKPNDVLRPAQEMTYRFSGPEGGCLNYFVFSCSARGRFIQ